MKNKLLWGILSIGIMIPCIVWASSPNGRVQWHPVSSSQYLQNTCNGDAIENFTCDYTWDPVVLRMWYGVDFYDTFYAWNQDRRLRGFCAGIIEPENNGDYNNWDNPWFVRTGGINTVLWRKVPANTGITIIQTAREYQIRKHPLQRSSNNLMVKYVVEYANNSADNATRYQHTECYPYIISRCGDGVVDEDWDGKTADKPAEQCDPEAPEWKNRPDWKICNSSCEIEYATPKCSSTYNWISKYTSSSSPWLSWTENLCEVWNPVGFSYSGAPRIFTWNCKNWSTTTSSPCVAQQQWCGDGIKNWGETCDFEDTTNKDWRWNGWCSNQCKPIVVEDPICSSSYNGQRLLSLTAWVHLCTKWTYTGFSYSESNHKWTWKCNNILWTSVDCLAIKQYCGDGIKDAWEECDDWDKNGTNTSACSATCTNVGSATCGSLWWWNTYFPGGKQSNPWLTKTSPWMCSNGAIVGEPYITWTDSHIEWTCSNLNWTSIYCKAYQQYCGDGKINGWEECDGGELCSSSCKSVNPSIACNQNFTWKLRLWYNEPFTDTLNAWWRDQYLYYKEVLFKENHGDYNNGSNPEFNWTSELVRNWMKVGAHSSMIILESNPYHIVSAPSKRAQNNIYIEYTIWYDYVKHSATPPKADLYPHKECAEYAISRCGDGIVDEDYGEVCDPEAPEWKNRQDWQVCNAECKKETSKRWDFVVEKTLLSDRYITKTWQELEWKIKVTASWYVENVVIKDDLPPVLSYVTSSSNLTPSNSVQMKPNQPTITSWGKHLEWETTWILESWNSIVLSVITKVDMMPDKDWYENVACAWAEGLNEKCDHEPIPTKWDPDLRIKKTFTDWTKEKTVKVWDEIAYRIDFGNRGKAPATITSIKDFLPKNVQYITGSIYIDRASTHSNSTQTWDMELMEWLKIVDGVRIEIYGWMTVKPGDVWHIIITWVVKGDFTDNRTNFACIYLNDELIGCDDVTHHIWGEVLCKSNIEKNKSNDLCNGNSWTVPVKCNSDWWTADKIEILCDGSV